MGAEDVTSHSLAVISAAALGRQSPAAPEQQQEASQAAFQNVPDLEQSAAADEKEGAASHLTPEICHRKAHIHSDAQGPQIQGPPPQPHQRPAFTTNCPDAYVSEPVSPREVDSQFEGAKVSAAQMGAAKSAPQVSIRGSDDSDSDDRAALSAFDLTPLPEIMPAGTRDSDATVALLGGTGSYRRLPADSGSSASRAPSALYDPDSLAMLISEGQHPGAPRRSLEVARAAAVVEAAQAEGAAAANASRLRPRRGVLGGGAAAEAWDCSRSAMEAITAALAADEASGWQWQLQRPQAMEAAEAADVVLPLQPPSYYQSNRAQIINEQDVTFGQRPSMTADANLDEEEDVDVEGEAPAVPIRGWSAASPEELIAAAFENGGRLEQYDASYQQPAQAAALPAAAPSVAAPSLEAPTLAIDSMDGRAATLGMSRCTFDLTSLEAAPSDNASASREDSRPRQDAGWRGMVPSDEATWGRGQPTTSGNSRPARRKDWSNLTEDTMLPPLRTEATPEAPRTPLGPGISSPNASVVPLLDTFTADSQISRPVSAMSTIPSYVPPQHRVTQFSEQQAEALASNGLSWVMFIPKEARAAAMESASRLPSEYGGSTTTSRRPSLSPIARTGSVDARVEQEVVVEQAVRAEQVPRRQQDPRVQQDVRMEQAAERPNELRAAHAPSAIEAAASQLLEEQEAPHQPRSRHNQTSFKSKFRAFFGGGSKSASEAACQLPELLGGQPEQGGTLSPPLTASSRLSPRDTPRSDTLSSGRPKSRQQLKAEVKAEEKVAKVAKAARRKEARATAAAADRQARTSRSRDRRGSLDFGRRAARQGRGHSVDDQLSRSGRSTPGGASTATYTSDAAYSRSNTASSAAHGGMASDATMAEPVRHAYGPLSRLLRLPSSRGSAASRASQQGASLHQTPLSTPAPSRHQTPIPSPLSSRQPSPLPSPRSFSQYPPRQVNQRGALAEASAPREPTQDQWTEEDWANATSSVIDEAQAALRGSRQSPGLSTVGPRYDRSHFQPQAQPQPVEAPSGVTHSTTAPAACAERSSTQRGPLHEPGSTAAQEATLLALRPQLRILLPDTAAAEASTPRLHAGPPATPPRNPHLPEAQSASPSLPLTSPYLAALAMAPLSSSFRLEDTFFDGRARSTSPSSLALARSPMNATSIAASRHSDELERVEHGLEQQPQDLCSDELRDPQPVEGEQGAEGGIRSARRSGSASRERMDLQLPMFTGGDGREGRGDYHSDTARVTADLLSQRPASAQKIRRKTGSRSGPPDTATISQLSSARLARLDRQLAEDAYNMSLTYPDSLRRPSNAEATARPVDRDTTVGTSLS